MEISIGFFYSASTSLQLVMFGADYKSAPVGIYCAAGKPRSGDRIQYRVKACVKIQTQKTKP